MSLSTIWVYADAAADKPLAITLELLAKARSLGASSVEAFCGGDGTALAPVLGAHGAAKVHHVGDLGGRLPGPSVAAAMAAAIDAGAAPDLIMFGMTYEGRDVVARLSVKLGKTVLTNNNDVRVDGDEVICETAIFGGNTVVETAFVGAGPHLAMFRPKSFTAEEGAAAAGELVSVSVPELGASGAARVTERHVEASSGPKLDEANVVVSGGRGLGDAANYALIED